MRIFNFRNNSLGHRLGQYLVSKSKKTELKLEWDAYPRPNYAYGINQAAVEAKALGVGRIAAIEFGVAGGQGLVAMECIAEELSHHHGVEIDIFGFDTGSGQPAALDYRDAPYIWAPGQFPMNETLLRSHLRRARLFIGLAKDNLNVFLSSRPPPIGFMAFDMDYYSSTVDVFPLLDQSHEMFLPRTFCYFDDIIGHDNEFHSEFTGELLAINEFNQAREGAKLARINGLSHKRRFPARWNDQMFVFHRFEDPRYSCFINWGNLDALSAVQGDFDGKYGARQQSLESKYGK
jgi:hypothetical protein